MFFLSTGVLRPWSIQRTYQAGTACHFTHCAEFGLSCQTLWEGIEYFLPALQSWTWNRRLCLRKLRCNQVRLPSQLFSSRSTQALPSSQLFHEKLICWWILCYLGVAVCTGHFGDILVYNQVLQIPIGFAWKNYLSGKRSQNSSESTPNTTYEPRTFMRLVHFKVRDIAFCNSRKDWEPTFF